MTCRRRSSPPRVSPIEVDNVGAPLGLGQRLVLAPSLVFAMLPALELGEEAALGAHQAHEDAADEDDQAERREDPRRPGERGEGAQGATSAAMESQRRSPIS